MRTLAGNSEVNENLLRRRLAGLKQSCARDFRRWPLFLLALCLTTGCSVQKLGFLNAAGPVAREERHLFMIVAVVMLFVVGPVIVLTPVFAWHYRLANTHNAFRPRWSFSWILEFFIWIPPTAIVVGLSVLLWPASRTLDPYTPIPSSFAPIEIQAVAFDWKWLFIYPNAGIAAVDEVDIPAGRPIHISLTSVTVMQSLFVPQLAGQIYAMPAMVTQLNLSADKQGTYLGANTQYNGAGFARDSFKVVAKSPAEFEQWIKRAQHDSPAFTEDIVKALLVKKIDTSTTFFATIPENLFDQLVSSTRLGSAVNNVGGPSP